MANFDPHAFVADFDPEAFAGKARESKYPQPRSMTAGDEELGLRTGPVSSARMPGTALSVPLRPSMSDVESEHINDQIIDASKRVENTLGGAAVGSGLGLAGRAALAAPGGRIANAADVLTKGISNSYLHGGGPGIGVNVLKALFPGLGSAVADVGAAGGVAATGAAGAVAGSMIPETESPMQRAVRLLLGQQPTFPQGE